jgi:uncharacterized protein (TIGR02246 family)
MPGPSSRFSDEGEQGLRAFPATPCRSLQIDQPVRRARRSKRAARRPFRSSGSRARSAARARRAVEVTIEMLCSGSGSGRADSLNADADRAAIARVMAELLEAVNASDVARLIAVWAEDGVLMPPNQPSVQGRRALEEHFRRVFSHSRFEFTFTSSDIELAGNAAFERLTYTARAWPAGSRSPIEDRGKGLHVYRRQADGSWKLVRDIWNSDQPAALSS